MFRFVVAAVLAASPCSELGPPDVPPPGDGLDFEGGFADTIFSFSAGGTVQDCATEVEDCDAATNTDCGPVAVLGMPDGDTWTLMPGDRIILAFRCSSIRENGGVDTADLKLWASLDETARATVAVSVAGANFEIVNEVSGAEPLTAENPELDLGRINLEVAQFVQIVSTGTGEIRLDAVEALVNPPTSE
jgi:hypothetical protein